MTLSCCVRHADEAQRALAFAERFLREELGVTLHPQKTRIVHVSHGFEFLGYKVKQGHRYRLAASKRRSRTNPQNLYAVPREKSVTRFKDQIRRLTRRKAPLKLREVIQRMNPVIRGWGTYYRKAHVRRLFHQLDGGSSAASTRFWPNAGGIRCGDVSHRRLIEEFGLVRLTPSHSRSCPTMIPGGAVKESGLRENCTSRLNERTEAGWQRPTSSDSTGGATQTPGEIRTDELGTRPVNRKSRGRKLLAYTGLRLVGCPL